MPMSLAVLYDGMMLANVFHGEAPGALCPNSHSCRRRHQAEKPYPALWV